MNRMTDVLKEFKMEVNEFFEPIGHSFHGLVDSLVHPTLSSSSLFCVSLLLQTPEPDRRTQNTATKPIPVQGPTDRYPLSRSLARSYGQLQGARSS